MAIDSFLRSLAQECGSRAIGVILSGAGTDGAGGLEAVKAAGGMTFAQDPATAKFDSMPQAAIDTGSVDFVLSPEAIGAELVKLGHHSYVTEDESTGPTRLALETGGQFDPILTLLRDASGLDFTLYRENMIQRRIMRRLALRNLDNLEAYRKQLENDPGELAALQKDLLISVTQFFRDPESFESLKKLVIPRLVHDRPAGAAIRIWVPGCATGEEVYSIAITLHEYLSETKLVYPIQIFASDVSSMAIEKARRGKYAENIAADVSPERLKRYFVKVEGGYQISTVLREICVFSKHDLIQDPPFSKLDLISCRNVLIFFGSVRRNVVALFHYALKPGGFLVLGPSETESGPLFSVVEGSRSIYTKNETDAKRYLLYAGAAGSGGRADQKKAAEVAAGEPANRVDLRKGVERALLSRYSGAGVIVDDSLEVLEIIGRTPPYLRLPIGKASLNLLKLIPETRLFLEVEKLVRETQSSGEPHRMNRVPYQSDGASGEVNVEVVPLGAAPTRALLIVFEPAAGAPEIGQGPSVHPGDAGMARLKQDLADLRERLQSIIDERQSSADESQNEAEEALSANEELQSLNEELETAKEELQSTNEELATVNEELRANNTALASARDFAMLIIETAQAPLLVLDMDLRIISANPAFYRAFRLSRGEAEGQFLYSIADGCWGITGVRNMLQRVLPENKSFQNFEIEQDFPGIGHRVLVLSARQLDGLQQILLGIEDVTERKERAEAALHESEERFRNMADTAPVMIWVAGPDKACTFINKAWLDFTGRTLEQELGNGWSENVHPEDLAGCMETYSSAFYGRRSFQMEYRARRADGEYRWLLDNGVPRYQQGDVFAGYIGSCVDVTDLKRTQEEHLAKQKLLSVGTLAGGIAHDFNNLLGGVLAHAELALAELASGSRPEEELQKIRAVAIRGAEIVRQLMIYAGKESDVLELVDVSRTVEDMLELLKVSVSKHAAVETDLGKALPRVRANSAQLLQVVMNLIANASDAIGDQDGVIRVTTRLVVGGRNSPKANSERLPEGDYVQLEVADTGRGMTPDVQARMFDPFFTTRSAGHGLGLAVVQGIVRSLNGTIRVVSAPGKGTKFQMWLPAAEHTAQATRRTVSRATEIVPPSPDATILMVEDEDPLRHAVAKMLRKTGFSVLEARDGSDALDMIRAHQNIQVLFLDITVPRRSSREVLEEGKRLRPNMRVIATSAYSEQTAATTLGASVEHFIRKPYRPSDVVSLLRETIS
jgi:two-component system CheB/CheR fusion protein